MSGYKRVNFYELCRLCASNQQKEKTHIFHEEGKKIQLQNKIQSLLSLKVCENDYLPKVVCSECLQSLETCYTFRNECISSETMLSTYFNNFRYTEDFTKSGKVYIKDTEKPLIKVETQDESQQPASDKKIKAINSNGEVINVPIVDANKKTKRLQSDDPMIIFEEKNEPKTTFQVPYKIDLKNLVINQVATNKPDYFKVNDPYFVNCTPDIKVGEETLNTIAPNWMESITLPPDKGKLKIFECAVCKKSFKRREHLYQHEKLHTGYRPFICEHCNKSFMRKEHLLRHMTSHSGLKNFQCNICAKSFSRNDNLLKHRKTHERGLEREGNLQCEICNKQFVLKHYYAAHKAMHENDSKNKIKFTVDWSVKA